MCHIKTHYFFALKYYGARAEYFCCHAMKILGFEIRRARRREVADAFAFGSVEEAGHGGMVFELRDSECVTGYDKQRRHGARQRRHGVSP